MKNANKKVSLQTLATALVWAALESFSRGQNEVAGVMFVAGLALFALYQHYGIKQLPGDVDEQSVIDSLVRMTRKYLTSRPGRTRK